MAQRRWWMCDRDGYQETPNKTTIAANKETNINGDLAVDRLQNRVGSTIEHTTVKRVDDLHANQEKVRYTVEDSVERKSGEYRVVPSLTPPYAGQTTTRQPTTKQ